MPYVCAWFCIFWCTCEDFLICLMAFDILFLMLIIQQTFSLSEIFLLRHFKLQIPVRFGSMRDACAQGNVMKCPILIQF